MNILSLILIAIGFSLFGLEAFGTKIFNPNLSIGLAFGLLTIGSLIFFSSKYLFHPAGVNNTKIWLNSLTARGIWGWILGFIVTGFYVLLYWFPNTLSSLTKMMDSLAYILRGSPADQWFLYGSFYTFAILIMGIRALIKYRHSRYQLVRTSVIIFSQLVFAYLIPNILKAMQKPEFYFSYFWPLKPEYLFPSTVHSLQSAGALGQFMVFWGVIMSFIAVPLLTYYFGKRWYCSWVCGCGGLANTMGDPWRQLSDKSLGAWKLERWMIHSVLVLVTFTTLLLWTNSFLEGGVLGSISHGFSKAYGFFIGAVFSGIIGVGFYPILGTRVWCRFGCPQAAILGIIQKYFSRFRITTNGGQCISCGNCSTYCEMGIDVRSYVQKGQNIVRASCVGCGICSTVCPRGVLKLENGAVSGRV
ncbi:MAG: 4Fe-4S binding protein [Leptospira sp.]|nr:4Fe-4S binding protein [Leptospira sp.]